MLIPFVVVAAVVLQLVRQALVRAVATRTTRAEAEVVAVQMVRQPRPVQSVLVQSEVTAVSAISALATELALQSVSLQRQARQVQAVAVAAERIQPEKVPVRPVRSQLSSMPLMVQAAVAAVAVAERLQLETAVTAGLTEAVAVVQQITPRRLLPLEPEVPG